MIQAQSLTRRYGRFTAVNRVSFQISRNSIVGLLGHNGAGKTSIMKMLSGYLEPSAGSLQVAGHDYRQGCRKVQSQLGYLPEHLPVYPDMMVADYLDYAASLKQIPRAQRPAAIREVMLATDLHERMLDRIGTLSRGLRQRVGVAQAILGNPSLLILDEPGNGLDPEQTQQMRALIKRLSRRATILLSTHIMQEVDAVCDRVLILHRGNLALDATLDDLRNSDTLLLRVGESDTASLTRALGELPDIAALKQHERGEFHLQLRAHSNCEEAAASVARSVIAQGAALYTLQPRYCDLESVFRAATSADQARLESCP